MNIVVVVMDSLRVDHVGCYGSHVRTPNIDRVAGEGTVFLNAFTESLPTVPTRTTWWTGKTNFPFRRWKPFESGDLLLSEVLWDRGFTSALITDVYHMHKPTYNLGRGFDQVVFVRGQEYDPWIIDESVPIDLSRHRLRDNESDALWKPRFSQYLRNMSSMTREEDYCAPRVAREAMRWLDDTVLRKGIKDNLFLWVDMFDPHEPWDPPEPWRSMYDPGYGGHEIIDPVPGDVAGYMTPDEIRHTMALYAGEISFVDKWVGLLLDRVRDLGLMDDTVIMLTTDHGEPFGEHGYIRKARPYNHEQLAHIPWIVCLPGGVGAGRKIEGLVQTTDLMPTVLDALGIERFFGATQWTSKALYIHTKFGPLDLHTAYTPAHSIHETLTYGFEVTDECLRVAAGDPSLTIQRPSADVYLHADDIEAMRTMQAEIEAGAKFTLVGPPGNEAGRIVHPIARVV